MRKIAIPPAHAPGKTSPRFARFASARLPPHATFSVLPLCPLSSLNTATSCGSQQDGVHLALTKINPSANTHTASSGRDNKSRSITDEESYTFGNVLESGVIGITARKASMSQLAEVLKRSIGAPVTDQTGITGRYDFTSRFAYGLSAEYKSDAPSLLVALQENLGLTMTKHRGPVDTLVVDQIEEPSAN